MPALCRVRNRAEDEHGQDPEIQAAGEGEGDVNEATEINEALGVLHHVIDHAMYQPEMISFPH
jgi:hypothetical protein